jgi:ribosome-binding protein aMBF1 (putative translation factor)
MGVVMEMAARAYKGEPARSRAKKKAGRKEGRNITLHFSAEAMEKLTEIQEETAATSYAEVVRNALRMYDWMVKQKAAGVELLIKEPGQEIVRIELML